MKLTTKRIGGSVYYAQANQAENLLVLVHGLNCSDLEKYWSSIPALSTKQILPSCDLLCWKYDTNLGAFDKLRALKNRNPKLASAKRLGDALHTFLSQSSQHLQRPAYGRMFLFGHSQGGLVALNAAYTSITSNLVLPISGLCAASTPTMRSGLAALHNTISLGTNPQTRYLGRKRDYDDEIKIKLPAIRQRMYTKYISAIGDEVLQDEQLVNYFEDVEYIQGGHSWTSEIRSSSDPGFLAMKSFIEKSS